MMRPTEPIEVARDINDAFAATPFEAIREVTESTTGMADARERLTAMGPVELDLTQLWKVRSGRVARYGIYTSRAAALTALEQPREGVE